MMCDTSGDHLVLKTHDPCSSSTSCGGDTVPACWDNPRPSPYDKKTLERTDKWTYGPGICTRLSCGKRFGLLHRDHPAAKPLSYRAYTAPYDVSPRVRAEAEHRWLAQMSPDKLEVVKTKNLSAEETRKALLPPYLRSAAGFNPENLRNVDYRNALHFWTATGRQLDAYVPEWWALNPRYMTAWQLWLYTPLYLDVQVSQPGIEMAGAVLAKHPLMVDWYWYSIDAEEDWNTIVEWCDRQKEWEGKEVKEAEEVKCSALIGPSEKEDGDEAEESRTLLESKEKRDSIGGAMVKKDSV